MPHYVIKRSPEADEYLVWSTVSDSPVTSAVSRKFMECDLWLKKSQSETGTPGERMERADLFGTSALDGTKGWSDESFYVQLGPDDEFVDRVLTRDELFEIAGRSESWNKIRRTRSWS